MRAIDAISKASERAMASRIAASLLESKYPDLVASEPELARFVKLLAELSQLGDRPRSELSSRDR